MRSILENEANIQHIKGSDSRSENYLNYVDKMRRQAKDRIDKKKTTEEDKTWTSSTIENRISALNDTAKGLYDTLSDFVHGNNVQYHMNTEKFTTAYIKAVDSYFVGMFIDFMSELGIGLDMPDEKRRSVFDAIERAGGLHSKI